MTSSAIACRVSAVAVPMWGSRTTLAEPLEGGGDPGFALMHVEARGENPPALEREARARSSMIGPRAVLMTIASSGRRASLRASSQWRVAGMSGTCSESTWARRSLTGSARSGVRSRDELGRHPDPAIERGGPPSDAARTDEHGVPPLSSRPWSKSGVHSQDPGCGRWLRLRDPSRGGEEQRQRKFRRRSVTASGCGRRGSRAAGRPRGRGCRALPPCCRRLGAGARAEQAMRRWDP